MFSNPHLLLLLLLLIGYSTFKVAKFSYAVVALICTKAGGCAEILSIKQINEFLTKHQR